MTSIEIERNKRELRLINDAIDDCNNAEFKEVYKKQRIELIKQRMYLHKVSREGYEYNLLDAVKNKDLDMIDMIIVDNGRSIRNDRIQAITMSIQNGDVKVFNRLVQGDYLCKFHVKNYIDNWIISAIKHNQYDIIKVLVNIPNLRHNKLRNIIKQAIISENIYALDAMLKYHVKSSQSKRLFDKTIYCNGLLNLRVVQKK